MPLAFVSFIIIFFFTNLSQIPIAFSQSGPEGYWEKGNPMPTPRTEVTAANIADTVYVIGGFDTEGEPTDIVEIYNTTTNTWNTQIESLPIPLHHAAAASHQDKIYVIGGYSHDWTTNDRLFIYDPEANGWMEGASMPTPRGSPAANFVNGTLYVIGGDNENPIDITEAYDPINDEWVTKTPMPTSRHHAASAVVDDKIYVIGGRISGSLDNIDIVEEYDPLSDEWTTDLEPMPTKRSGIAASSLNNFIYVFGGEQNEGTFNNNERYDPASNTWIIQPPMISARHGLGAISQDGKIYVIGGGPTPGLTVSDANEIFVMDKR